MKSVGKESLDGVVQGPNPRRQPQRHRCGECQLRVVDDRVGQQPGIPQARLVARYVGEPGAARKLGHRQRRRDGDVGETTAGRSSTIGQLDADRLGGVDGTATAEADDPIHLRFRRALDGSLDLRHRRVLSDDHGDRRGDLAQRPPDLSDRTLLGKEGACGHQGHAAGLQTQ